eukprot:GHVQ01031253.1.p1 GENE.GHVQ01031253.1~~GHVQ01031253.1.p1  ORF type:complete len:172 (-),score=21.44 GHVQ01031253.1:91-606(-)
MYMLVCKLNMTTALSVTTGKYKCSADMQVVQFCEFFSEKKTNTIADAVVAQRQRWSQTQVKHVCDVSSEVVNVLMIMIGETMGEEEGKRCMYTMGGVCTPWEVYVHHDVNYTCITEKYIYVCIYTNKVHSALCLVSLQCSLARINRRHTRGRATSDTTRREEVLQHDEAEW